MKLTVEYYKHLEKIGKPIKLPRNHQLYETGNLPDKCYLIMKGLVVSFRYTNTGQEHIFSTEEPGALILLPSIILEHRVMLNFKTIEPSNLLSIGRKEIIDEITSDPSFALQTIYLLSQKFLDVYERFLAESHNIDTWKLCNLLLSLAAKYGTDYEGKVLVVHKYSQQMMADVLHINRTTVARAVKNLTSLGLIERINNFYCIRDIEKMKKHMDYLSRY